MTDLEQIATLGREDRQSLIRIGLQQPSVVRLRVEGPTGAANIGNAIHALEEVRLAEPSNQLLKAAYLAIQAEYPLHFAIERRRESENGEEPITKLMIKLSAYKACNGF